ncbi:MAG: hypothetical protein LBR68_02150 [Lachnoclostridium sp.]|nr:hypothetical protein [Lachnoclostridium sp.]
MPTQTKINQYTELLNRSVSGLHEAERWKNFLSTASRLYKYKFTEQAMIHAQRPDATACADYDLWKRPDVADRQVKRGSKGIALLDRSDSYPKIRYVFDISDTEARSNKKLRFWEINRENEPIPNGTALVLRTCRCSKLAIRFSAVKR